MTKLKEILEKHGCENIDTYTLISNYGATFTLNGIKYDLRHWVNCYGVYVGWRADRMGDAPSSDKKELNTPIIDAILEDVRREDV